MNVKERQKRDERSDKETTQLLLEAMLKLSPEDRAWVESLIDKEIERKNKAN